MKLTSLQSRRIVSNVKKVLKGQDIGLLSPQAYDLITQHMGFIAHFGLSGFQGVYRDLRELCRRLQTSEYSTDLRRNMEWADELDHRYASDPTDRGCGQPPTVTAAIRGIVELAREYAPEIRASFDAAQRDEELALAGRLAGKYGMQVTEPNIPTFLGDERSGT